MNSEETIDQIRKLILPLPNAATEGFFERLLAYLTLLATLGTLFFSCLVLLPSAAVKKQIEVLDDQISAIKNTLEGKITQEIKSRLLIEKSNHEQEKSALEKQDSDQTYNMLEALLWFGKLLTGVSLGVIIICGLYVVWAKSKDYEGLVRADACAAKLYVYLSTCSETIVDIEFATRLILLDNGFSPQSDKVKRIILLVVEQHGPRPKVFNEIVVFFLSNHVCNFPFGLKLWEKLPINRHPHRLDLPARRLGPG